MSDSQSKNQSLLKAFLLSRSTLLCLAIRISILRNNVPSVVQDWLSHPALQSIVSRPIVLNDVNIEALFGGQKQLSQLASQMPWLQLFADLLTAYALVFIGSTLRKEQDGDEEERTLQHMPDAIQPKYRVFAQTERTDDAVFLMPRRYLPLLSGGMYLWGTLLSSSTMTNQGYNGITSSLMAALMFPGSSSTGNALVPIFLIPLYQYLSHTERFQHQKQRLLAAFLVLTLYYYYATFSTALFEIPTYSTPNLGVLWYFSQQVFDRFRPYFGIMFFGIRFALVLPLAIRFGNPSHLMELTTCYWFVYTIFQTVHPTVTDLAICFALMLQSPRSLARMSVIPSLIALCSLPVPLILYCLDWHMWLQSGTGNANFIYFQCLAYHAFEAMLFIEFCGATVRRHTALQLTKAMRENDAT